MNYAILFCFLIALANSKVSKLGFKSLLNLKSFIEDNDYDDNVDRICKSGSEGKTACHAIPINSNYFQCCYVTEMDDIERESECDAIPKPFNNFKVLMEDKQFKALYREVLGYKKVYDESPDNRDEIIDDMINLGVDDIHARIECPNDETMEINIDDNFSLTEKNVLSSQNHCLNYFYLTMTSTGNTNYDCTKGELLQSSKDAGVECGTLQITSSGVKLKTCMLFGFEMFSNSKIQELISNQIKGEKESSNVQSQFTIEFSDSKGNIVKYDSEGKFTIGSGPIPEPSPDPNPNPNPNPDSTGQDNTTTPDSTDQNATLGNNSRILTISKYLSLLSLFLF